MIWFPLRHDCACSVAVRAVNGTAYPIDCLKRHQTLQCLRLGNPRSMQTLRNALRQPNDCYRFGVEASRI
jgi:hypothetical protein